MQVMGIRERSRPFVGGMLLCVVLSPRSVKAVSHPPAAGRKSRLLCMTIGVANGKDSQFAITIRNNGLRSEHLNLGLSLPNGRKWLDSIQLSLNDRSSRNNLVLVAKHFGIAPSTTDTYAVQLPRGGSVTIPIDLGDYWSPARKIYDLSLIAGKYALSASYTGRDYMRQSQIEPTRRFLSTGYWTGKLESNELYLEIQDGHVVHSEVVTGCRAPGCSSLSGRACSN